MPLIKEVRPVLLSAPYAHPDTNLEVQLHLPGGYRTCGLVEITLEDGTTGLGEGYAAVFAPRVFEQMILLLRPYLIDREVMDFNKIYQDLLLVVGYWSMQGAAMHALSAVEIALHDCRAKVLNMPVYELLGGKIHSDLKLYGSGGDSTDSEAMQQEFDDLNTLGITLFKIRARNHQANKAAWCMQEGQKRGIQIAIDMTQNLQNSGQSVADVVNFVNVLEKNIGLQPYFLEEVLGPANVLDYPLLRSKVNTKIAGGEIVTTAQELCQRIATGTYDIAQPDATVIGGIRAVLEVFATASRYATEGVVHCWGGPVGMMANYHAALAGGGQLAEWPMPAYPLREEMVVAPWQIEKGRLILPEVPGLGVELTKAIEDKYPFREEAVYHCLVDSGKIIPRWH